MPIYSSDGKIYEDEASRIINKPIENEFLEPIGQPSEAGSKSEAPLLNESPIITNPTMIQDQNLGMVEPSQTIFGGTEFEHFETLDEAIRVKGAEDDIYESTVGRISRTLLGDERGKAFVTSLQAAGSSRNSEDLIPLASEYLMSVWGMARAHSVWSAMKRSGPTNIPEALRKAKEAWDKLSVQQQGAKQAKEVEKALREFADKFKDFKMKDVTPSK